MGNPTIFRDDSAVAARAAEVPLASFANGVNNAGSCSCGIGINVDEGAVVGTLEQFTLLDQFGDARAGQVSQSIGGYPYVDNADYPSSGGAEGQQPKGTIFVVTNSANGDGTVTSLGNATLDSLSAGWTAIP